MSSVPPERSDQASDLFESGNAHYLAGRLVEAASYYRQVLSLAPGHSESHNNLGAALADLGQLDEACACYLRALHLNPNYADAHFNLGNAFRQLMRYAPAAASYLRATELQPQRSEFHSQLGGCLEKLGHLDEAEASYREALRLAPDDPRTLTGLGLVLGYQRRVEEAIACHTEALRLRPGFAEAHRNRALVRLLCGDYRNGWEDYEWRWRCEDFSYVQLTQPRWDGASLPEGTILLYSEQGYGDTLQFVRYTPQVKGKIGRVILATRRELIPLLRPCAGIDQWVPLGSELPHFDVHCPLMSIPHVLGTTEESIPAEIPYVFAESQRIDSWREELKSLTGFRIGLCWQGSSGNEYYHDHGIPLQCLEPLFDLDNAHWISLQKDVVGQELGAACVPLIDLSSRLDIDGKAFMDTAAVISLVDLVITFDTAVAHLAGAMGKPTWIALPHVPDWRWLLDRHDSPWYPTVRLFRQEQPGNWDHPSRNMREALSDRIQQM